MNEHIFGAEQQVKSSADETPAPEFDAMTWGAERALKAIVEYQVESLRFIARRHSNLDSCGICATAPGGRRSRKSSSLGSRSASPIVARSWAGSRVLASSLAGVSSRRSKAYVPPARAARVVTALEDDPCRVPDEGEA